MTCLCATVMLLSVAPVHAADGASEKASKLAQPETIKAYCLDFNWAGRKGFADPGT